MTWQDLPPPRSQAIHRSPLQISCRAGAGRTNCKERRVTLAFRTEFMGDECAWIVPGARVTVMLGVGEHAGMIRIQRDPQGKHRLNGSGGRPGSDKRRPVLVLRGYGWIPDETRRPRSVDHDTGAGWIEVSLPEWARIPGARQQPAAPAPAPRAAAPLRNGRSLTDHIPDPVAQGRRPTSAVRP